MARREKKTPKWKKKLLKGDIALVLPHSFFHDALRFYVKKEFKMANWTQMCYARFILAFIIEKQSWLSDEDYFATSSETSFDSFDKIMKEGGIPALGSENLITTLESVVKIRKEDDINKLDGNGSIIAVANDVQQYSKYDPIVIVHPSEKNNFIADAVNFYKKKKIKKANIPFLMLDAGEVMALLKQKYPEIWDIVKATTPEVFKMSILGIEKELENHPRKFE